MSDSEVVDQKPYTVDFIDLDDNNTNLVHLQEAKIEDLNIKTIISELRQKQYRLVDNNFNIANPGQHRFIVTVKHTYTVIDADNASEAIPKDELRRTGTQTVHYQGAGLRTPIDSKTTIEFNRSFVFDQTTGNIVKDNGWTKPSFRIIGTPDVLGYVADKSYVGGERANVNNPNRDYVVTYHLNEHPSSGKVSAVVKFVDLDAENRVLFTSKELIGDPYTAINYSTKDILDYLQIKGYELIDNGFDPNGQVEFFNNTDQQQIYFVSLGHQKIEVNSSNPVPEIDPATYEKECTSVVHYVGAGEITPKDQVQVVKITRTVTIDGVTKEILAKSEWQPAKERFSEIITPAIAGFNADKYSVKSHPVGFDDLEETVTYQANGRIIPVDEHGRVIPTVPHPQFETDPGNATKIFANELAPEIPGFMASQRAVTPPSPEQSVKVRYKLINKEEAVASIQGDLKKLADLSEKVKNLVKSNKQEKKEKAHILIPKLHEDE